MIEEFRPIYWSELLTSYSIIRHDSTDNICIYDGNFGTYGMTFADVVKKIQGTKTKALIITSKEDNYQISKDELKKAVSLALPCLIVTKMEGQEILQMLKMYPAFASINEETETEISAPTKSSLCE